MSVYVDHARIPYGRMRMSHMMADTTEELLDMAEHIGVAAKWIQHAGTHKEHFDICESKRKLAIAEGAVEVTPRELGELIRQRRRAQRCDVCDNPNPHIHCPECGSTEHVASTCDMRG